MNTDFRFVFPFLIPIVAIVMGVGIGMLALWLDYGRKRQIFESHHKERLAAIERGMEIPPLPAEFFRSGSLRVTVPTDYLRRGLVWLLLGLALTIALLMNRNLENATWGLLPTSIGLAYLIYFATVSRHPAPPQDPGSKN